MAVVNQLSQGNSEERRENGLGLIMIGFMLWCFDALVFFFMPAASRLGHPRPFAWLIGAALIAGIVLVVIGSHMRRKV